MGRFGQVLTPGPHHGCLKSGWLYEGFLSLFGHPVPQFPFTRSSRKGTLTSAAFVLAGITAAALATGACIVGILCLPLILLLVYKQRQVASHRRKYCPLGVQGWEAQ